eukprot:TRINITY_DN2806_c0_g1_i3.p1 TRINITY_DN2806_c0_g1~~TRINITY_DN2806_c0_g1_i3.p1  ORF type:complete len:456 (-),score=157.92 TRINITY_DN2806_c0_g1_i3:65-1432(-)
MAALRFAIGDRVYCNTGDWTPGTVVKQHYRENNWPAGKVVPYQIKLDDGRLIYAPVDDDKVIRQGDGEAPIDPEDVPDADKLPVTVITGFLGAGKTTLVNYILTQQHGMKIAVIENEFGAVNIDEELVSENLRTNEDIISMDNGCVCCTVRGDLVKALHELGKRADKLDAVIIETTGLADPAPVCFTFQTDPQVASQFRVDGIVCLVDCLHVVQHLDEQREDGSVNEAVQQVAFADRILINKTDLGSKEQILEVKDRVHSINSYAELIETNQEQRVPLERILGLGAFSLERAQDLSEWTEEPEEPEPECNDADCGHTHGHGHAECADAGCGHAHSHGHGHGHGHQEPEVLCEEAPVKRLKKVHNLSGVGSVGLTMAGSLDPQKFNAFMGELLQENSKDLYRSKGVVSLQGEGDTKFVFQGVHEQVVFAPAAEAKWQAGKERILSLIHISEPTRPY